MAEEDTVQRVSELLGSRAIEVTSKRKRRIFVRVERENYKPCIRDLVKGLDARHVSTMTGLDTGSEIEVLTHLFGAGSEITVKTALSRDNPEIESIIDIVPGADLYEREIHDLLGVKFTGRPEIGRFILPEDWPQGVYPLRKDFKKPR